MNAARLRRHELTLQLATLIATADDPALALRQHHDDLVDELVAARRNLASAGPLQEAFRAAVGFSVRVPDGLGEQEPPSGAVGSCSPSALGGRDDASPSGAAVSPLPVVPSGVTGPSRPPSTLRLVGDVDA